MSPRALQALAAANARAKAPIAPAPQPTTPIPPAASLRRPVTGLIRV